MSQRQKLYSDIQGKMVELAKKMLPGGVQEFVQ